MHPPIPDAQVSGLSEASVSQEPLSPSSWISPISLFIRMALGISQHQRWSWRIKPRENRTRKTQTSRTRTRDSDTIRTLTFFSFLLFLLWQFPSLSYWRNLELGLWNQLLEILILTVLSFTNWMILIKWLTFSAPQFPHRDNNSAYLLGSLEEQIL